MFMSEKERIETVKGIAKEIVKGKTTLEKEIQNFAEFAEIASLMWGVPEEVKNKIIEEYKNDLKKFVAEETVDPLEKYCQDISKGLIQTLVALANMPDKSNAPILSYLSGYTDCLVNLGIIPAEKAKEVGTRAINMMGEKRNEQ